VDRYTALYAIYKLEKYRMKLGMMIGALVLSANAFAGDDYQCTIQRVVAATDASAQPRNQAFGSPAWITPKRN